MHILDAEVPMRTAILLVLALLLVPATFADAQDADAGALAVEYVNPECSAERREKIVAELMLVPCANMLRPLKTLLRKKDARAEAIRLATVLRVHGLSGDIWRHLDDHEELYLDYLFFDQDKKLHDKLADRWVKLDSGSESFKRLDERMRSAWLHLDVLGEIRDELDSEARAAQALAVLQHQMDWPDATPAAITEEWDNRLKRVAHEGKPFDLKGNDLMLLPWDTSTAEPVRGNLRAYASTTLKLSPTPDAFQTRSFKLTLRIIAGKAETISICLETAKNQAHFIEYKGGAWTAKDNNSIIVNRMDWAELVIGVSKPTAKRADWEFTRTVNGRPMVTPDGTTNVVHDPVHTISITFGGETDGTVVGGAEWTWG
jgi:hypothetical protein